MIVSLMSNDSDISKIHFVVVFVDMAGDLRVVVKHGNSPFVFRNPSLKRSFSLTVVYKTQVVQLILYTVPDCGRSTLSWAFGCGNKLFKVLNGLKATLIC